MKRNRFCAAGPLGWTTVIRPRNTRSLNCRSEQLGPRFSINVRSWPGVAPLPGRRPTPIECAYTYSTCMYLRACKRRNPPLPSRPALNLDCATCARARASPSVSVCTVCSAYACAFARVNFCARARVSPVRPRFFITNPFSRERVNVDEESIVSTAGRRSDYYYLRVSTLHESLNDFFLRSSCDSNFRQ